MTILSIIAAVLGFFVGIKAPLFLQALIFIGIVIYLNSGSVREMELGALFPIMLGIVFILGMVVGDIYVMIFFHPIDSVAVMQGIQWLFRP